MSGPKDKLLAEVGAVVDRCTSMVDAPALVVAVSGGLDSMVLLHLLCRLVRKRHWKLEVAHFNHQLRGKESDADEVLVGERARALGLRFHSDRGDVQDWAARKKVSIEMAARELRHQFLATIARKTGARTIALAHHQDDQLELFFLRLFRGSSSQALSGMELVSPSPKDPEVRLIRPLLSIPKAELFAYAKRHKIVWREDASNSSLDYQRNRVRQELLPLLEKEYQPALREKIIQTMGMLAEESKVIAELAEQWCRDFESQKPGIRGFEQLPIAIQRQIIHRRLGDKQIAASFQLIEHLRTRPGVYACCETVIPAQKRDKSGKSCRVKREGNGRVTCELAESESPLWNCEEKRVRVLNGNWVFGGVRFCLRVSSESDMACPKGFENARREIFDATAIGRSIQLRFWQPGDRYRPIGMQADKKLQDCFTDLKVPLQRRHERLIACAASGEIFWVEGLRISEKFKVTPETRVRLFWWWKRA
jgi:tRNA(Ile)-lysidine synthase